MRTEPGRDREAGRPGTTRQTPRLNCTCIPFPPSTADPPPPHSVRSASRPRALRPQFPLPQIPPSPPPTHTHTRTRRYSNDTCARSPERDSQPAGGLAGMATSTSRGDQSSSSPPAAPSDLAVLPSYPQASTPSSYRRRALFLPFPTRSICPRPIWEN